MHTVAATTVLFRRATSATTSGTGCFMHIIHGAAHSMFNQHMKQAALPLHVKNEKNTDKTSGFASLWAFDLFNRH